MIFIFFNDLGAKGDKLMDIILQKTIDISLYLK